MKRFLTCLLCVLMLLPALPASAWMGEAEIRASASAVRAGEEVTFTVSVYGVGLQSMALQLGETFDSRQFTFVSGKWLVDGLLSDVDADKLNAVIAFSKKTTLDNEAVFTFTLRAREDAPAGEAAVRVKVILNDGEVNREFYSGYCRLPVNGGATTAATSFAPSAPTSTTPTAGVSGTLPATTTTAVTAAETDAGTVSTTSLAIATGTVYATGTPTAVIEEPPFHRDDSPLWLAGIAGGGMLLAAVVCVAVLLWHKKRK